MENERLLGPAERDLSILSEFKLSDKQRQAIGFIAESGITLKWTAIADQVGVRRETLWRWKQLPEFQRAIDSVVLGYVRSEEPYIVQALAETAKDKNNKDQVAAARVVLEYLNKLKETDNQKYNKILESWQQITPGFLSKKLSK